MKKRYQVLREFGFGILTSALVAALNSYREVPEGEVWVMNLVIEYPA